MRNPPNHDASLINVRKAAKRPTNPVVRWISPRAVPKELTARKAKEAPPKVTSPPTKN